MTQVQKQRDYALMRLLQHERNIYHLARSVMDKKRFKNYEKKCMRKMWYLTGVLKYQIDKNALCKVMFQLRKIGCIPKGYCYPELISSQKMPERLRQ